MTAMAAQIYPTIKHRARPEREVQIEALDVRLVAWGFTGTDLLLAKTWALAGPYAHKWNIVGKAEHTGTPSPILTSDPDALEIGYSYEFTWALYPVVREQSRPARSMSSALLPPSPRPLAPALPGAEEYSTTAMTQRIPEIPGAPVQSPRTPVAGPDLPFVPAGEARGRDATVDIYGR